MDMTQPKIAVALTVVLAMGAALVGCGGDGGATTTTAAETGVVTIQTDTRVTNTDLPASTTTGAAQQPAPSRGITGNAQLDAAIVAMSKAIRGTVSDMAGSADATALTTAITARAEAFDRAVQQVHDVVAEDGAQVNTQQAIADAARALSAAYRTFTDAAAQAADTNDAATLTAAKAALTDALHTFDEAAGTGN